MRGLCDYNFTNHVFLKGNKYMMRFIERHWELLMIAIIAAYLILLMD